MERAERAKVSCLVYVLWCALLVHLIKGKQICKLKKIHIINDFLINRSASNNNNINNNKLYLHFALE